MSFSNYLENALLDHIFGNATFSTPAEVYVALFDADPGETGAANEISGNAYARVATSGSHWNSASGGSLTNALDIQFPQASGGSWGTITHFGIFDSGSTGNFLGGGSLNSSKAVAEGDTPKFSAGDITITLD